MLSRVGYLEMVVPDLERSVAHAVEILGLREVERIDGVVYLTCNERHHELVLVEGPVAGLGCVALEASSAEDFAEIEGRLSAAGVTAAEVTRPGVSRGSGSPRPPASASSSSSG